MKLSEALILRKDIQSRLDEMENRLCACALTQEGESPAEDPAALLAELESLTSQHCELCARINLTNSRTMTEGQSLTELLARRDALGRRQSLLSSLLSSASQAPRRASGREIRILPTVDIPALRKRLDASAKELRELDMRIQQINWTVDLQ
ncbi:MAG: DIP1984 family protein [Clostridiales bacterium]|nr:DIP1984 family protein [Eubacteriales bacterium]MCI5765212.1 DIP1984 family protein [Clostridiales bacterium]